MGKASRGHATRVLGQRHRHHDPTSFATELAVLGLRTRPGTCVLRAASVFCYGGFDAVRVCEECVWGWRWWEGSKDFNMKFGAEVSGTRTAAERFCA
eukprot:2505273-Rhodomonas_salina.1